MATTPKLGLYQPVGTDIDHAAHSLSDQIQIIDDKFDCVYCTSTTRPAVPFTGQLIFETDTLQVKEWNGAAPWKTILDARMGFGKCAYQSAAGPFSTVGKNSEEGPFLSGTFNEISGRRYRVAHSINLDSSGTPVEFGGSKINIRNKAGATVGKTDNLAFWTWADVMSNGTNEAVNNQAFFEYVATADRQVTYGLFLSRDNTNGTILMNGNQFHTFIIEDVGM